MNYKEAVETMLAVMCHSPGEYEVGCDDCPNDDSKKCRTPSDDEIKKAFEILKNKTEPTGYLTTEELIKGAEALGFRSETFEEGIWITDFGSEDIATVYRNEPFSLDTAEDGFDGLERKEKEALYNLLDRYARTPLDKRVEEKRFYLKKKRDVTYKYLVLDAREKDYGWCSNPEILAEGARTFVVKDEIPKLKKKFKELNFDELERVEVE